MPHPSYSSGIAPNDFYLFIAIKQRLCGCQGRSFEELQGNVQQILEAIPQEEILATLRDRKARLHRMIATN
jgi:hypothetical protein